MDDLISRSALLEELKDFRMTITGSANAMALVVMDETKKSITRIIEEQPTDYDKDKVVEQIDAIMKDESIRFCDQAVNVAKRIVENGGVSA